MTRPYPDVEQWLKSNEPSGRGMCLNTSQRAFGADPMGASDATEAVGLTRDLHTGYTTNIPAGAHVLYTGGSEGHGHSVVADGDGWLYTVDWYSGLNITRVRQTDMENAWGNLRWAGWSAFYGSQPLDTADTPDPGPDPDPDTGDDGMTYRGDSTDQPLALPPGEWLTLRINDDGDMSMLSGPADFSAQVQVVASGLEPGDQLAVRFKLIDCKSGEDSERVSTYPSTEIVGTGGNTAGSAAQLGTIGDPGDGWSRRLRAEAMTYGAGVVLESVQARTQSSGT